jgi:hypothetical protein
MPCQIQAKEIYSFERIAYDFTISENERPTLNKSTVVCE